MLGIVDPEMSNNRANTDVTAEILFMAILNRLTGRPKVYTLFRKSKSSQHEQPILPATSEIEEFIDFLESNVLHKYLFSPQHGDLIPCDLKIFPNVFRKFLMALTQKIVSLQSYIVSSTNRKCAVTRLTETLTNILDGCKTHFSERGDRSGKKLAFIAHQVVSDLEEIYWTPFGPVTTDSIVFGYGSSQGYYICFGKVSKGSDILAVSDDVRNNLDFFRNNIESELSADSESSICLTTAMGMKVQDDKIVVAINNRPIVATDIEHFLCKIYIGAAKTVGSRSQSLHPKTSRAGYHPIPFEESSDIPWDDNNITQIMEKIIQSHKKFESPLRRTPSIFLHNDEIDPWKHGQDQDRLEAATII